MDMIDASSPSKKLRYGWASLWRCHLDLPRELVSREVTLYVRAVGREAAIAATEGVIFAMYPSAEPRGAFYNLTSAHKLVDHGVSDIENHRLFETGWQGDRVVAWVESPIFVVADAAELYEAWSDARLSGLLNANDV